MGIFTKTDLLFGFNAVSLIFLPFKGSIIKTVAEHDSCVPHLMDEYAPLKLFPYVIHVEFPEVVM